MFISVIIMIVCKINPHLVICPWLFILHLKPARVTHTRRILTKDVESSMKPVNYISWKHLRASKPYPFCATFEESFILFNNTLIIVWRLIGVIIGIWTGDLCKNSKILLRVQVMLSFYLVVLFLYLAQPCEWASWQHASCCFKIDSLLVCFPYYCDWS